MSIELSDRLQQCERPVNFSHNLVNLTNPDSQHLFCHREGPGINQSAPDQQFNDFFKQSLNQDIYAGSSNPLGHGRNSANPLDQGMNSLRQAMGDINDVFNLASIMQNDRNLSPEQTKMIDQRISNDLFMAMINTTMAEFSCEQALTGQLWGQKPTSWLDIGQVGSGSRGDASGGGGKGAAAGGDTTPPAAGDTTPPAVSQPSDSPAPTTPPPASSDSPAPIVPPPAPSDSPAPIVPPPPGSSDSPVPTSEADAIAKADIPPLPSDALNVRTQFKATGDGSTDDTAAIQKAINDCPAGGTVYVPDGTYMVNIDNGGIRMKNGVTLQMSPGATLRAMPSSEDGGAIIEVQSVSNVNIYGGTLLGDRQTHGTQAGETRSGVGVYGSSNVNIVGVTSRDNFGDGIEVVDGNDGTSHNVTLSNDVGSGNRRDGLSVVSVDGATIENCVFNNNGGNDSYDQSLVGTGRPVQLPMAGIDVEPDPGKIVSNLVIKNNLIMDNATACSNVADNGDGFGIEMTGGWGAQADTGNQVIGNVVADNAKGGISVWTGQQTVSDNTVTQDSNGLMIYGGSQDGSGNTVNGASANFVHG